MAYNFNFLFYCVFHLGIAEKVMTSLTSQNISFHFTNQGLLTRSKPVPYDSNLCFFCEEKAKYQNPLHLLSTSSAGSSLDNAVKQSKDPKLLVKLSTALDMFIVSKFGVFSSIMSWANGVQHSGWLCSNDFCSPGDILCLSVQFAPSQWLP